MGRAEEATLASLFAVVESVRYCMLDSSGTVSRPTADILADRAAFPGLVADLRENFRALQTLVSAGIDPSGLASTRSVSIANFENAPVVRAGISILETDSAAQVGLAGDFV